MAQGGKSARAFVQGDQNSKGCFVHAVKSANDVKDEAWPRIAVGIVSDCRYVSDCKSRGREFDPGPVPYFRGD